MAGHPDLFLIQEGVSPGIGTKARVGPDIRWYPDGKTDHSYRNGADIKLAGYPDLLLIFKRGFGQL